MRQKLHRTPNSSHWSSSCSQLREHYMTLITTRKGELLLSLKNKLKTCLSSGFVTILYRNKTQRWSLVWRNSYFYTVSLQETSCCFSFLLFVKTAWLWPDKSLLIDVLYKVLTLCLHTLKQTDKPGFRESVEYDTLLVCPSRIFYDRYKSKETQKYSIKKNRSRVTSSQHVWNMSTALTDNKYARLYWRRLTEESWVWDLTDSSFSTQKKCTSLKIKIFN